MESIAMGAARRAAPFLTLFAVQWGAAWTVHAEHGAGLPTFLVLPNKPALKESQQVERLPLVELELKQAAETPEPQHDEPAPLPAKPRRKQLTRASVNAASSYLRSVVVAADEFVGLSASPQLPLKLRETTVSPTSSSRAAKSAGTSPVSSVDPALVAHLFPRLPRVVSAPADSPFAAPVGMRRNEPVVVAAPQPAKPVVKRSPLEPVVVAVAPTKSTRAGGADLGESVPPAAAVPESAPVEAVVVAQPAESPQPRETARSRWLAQQLAPKPEPKVIEGFPGTPNLEDLVRQRQLTRIPRERELPAEPPVNDVAATVEVPAAGPPAREDLAVPVQQVPVEPFVAEAAPVSPPPAAPSEATAWPLPQLDVPARPANAHVVRDEWTQELPAAGVPVPLAPVVSPIAPPVAAQVPSVEESVPPMETGIEILDRQLPLIADPPADGGAWEPVDLRGVELESAKPKGATPAKVAIAEDRLLAEKAVQHGFELAQRRAHFSARARFIEALRVVARSLDEQSYGTQHTKALKRALTAYDEAADFFPRSYRPDQEVNLAMAIGGHNTAVLHEVDPDLLTPNQCAREYLALAEREFVAALGRDPQGAQALYGLGRLESAVATTASNAEILRAQRSMVLYQASLLVDESNFAAANELGVLLARYAKYEQAIVAWQHCLAHSPQSTAWVNLASVYQKLGRLPEAEHAQRQARQTVGQEPTLPFVANRPSVEWVDPEAFLSAPAQVLPSLPQQPAPEMQQAEHPRNAPPVRTAAKPKRPRIFGFGR